MFPQLKSSLPLTRCESFFVAFEKTISVVCQTEVGLALPRYALTYVLSRLAPPIASFRYCSIIVLELYIVPNQNENETRIRGAKPMHSVGNTWVGQKKLKKEYNNDDLTPQPNIKPKVSNKKK